MKTRIDDIENRNAPKVYEKLVKENAGLGANLVNRKVKEKYNYYICDYCGEEIKIKKKGNDQDGQFAVFSMILIDFLHSQF